MLTSVLTVVAVILSAPPARAQGVELGDPRWAPWLGCWLLIQDVYEPPVAATVGRGDTVVCVHPASTGRGVDVTTFVGARTIPRQTVTADGAVRPVSQPGCSGTQQREWSLSGRRLLTRGTVACGGRPPRTTSGISLISGGPTWLDIQAFGVSRDARIRIRRYQRAGGPPDGVVLPADLQEWLTAGTTNAVASTSMTRDEIVDASGKIAAPALEAALRETGSPFDLNSALESEVAVVPEEADGTAFPHPNWWSNFDFPHRSTSVRPVVVTQRAPARTSSAGPHWWGARYSGSPRQSAAASAGPVQHRGGGPHWWGNRYSESSPPSAVVPDAPARPSDGAPSWWGNRYSSNP